MAGSATNSAGAWRSLTRNAAGAPAVFPPLERVQIERIAGTDPAAYGLQLTHWDCRSLQPLVVAQGVVAAIHYTTGAHLLAKASLQPHRSRDGKTATIDEDFRVHLWN